MAVGGQEVVQGCPSVTKQMAKIVIKWVEGGEDLTVLSAEEAKHLQKAIVAFAPYGSNDRLIGESKGILKYFKSKSVETPLKADPVTYRLGELVLNQSCIDVLSAVNRGETLSYVMKNQIAALKAIAESNDVSFQKLLDFVKT
jgi:hypothetical protein